MNSRADNLDLHSHEVAYYTSQDRSIQIDKFLLCTFLLVFGVFLILMGILFVLFIARTDWPIIFKICLGTVALVYHLFMGIILFVDYGFLKLFDMGAH